MTIVQEIESFYDEVWCSWLDVDAVKSVFNSTPIKPKSYVKIREVILIKNKGSIRQPGFRGVERREVVCRMELRDEKLNV